MKLFFKHLARVIIKKPLQPIILIFTLTLAIAMTIFSLSMRDALDEEMRLAQAARYGNAQITIGLNGNASSRFMFAEDAETVLGEDAVAAGVFELPLAMGEERKTVFGVACDFTQIGKVFDFTFTEYGTVTPSSVGRSAFVTQKFIEENDLKLGDGFTVTAFGEEKSYTVCGVARHRFMGSYDVMVDITGVIRLITDGSPLLSALGDRFKPSSTIYVHLAGETSISECVERLQSDSRFADKTLTDVSDFMRVTSNVDALGYIIDVSSMLAVLLAAGVTFCCFYIIASERTEENYVFTLSGAKSWMLNVLQYAEISAYWLASALLGCALAMPLTDMLFGWAGFNYASSAIAPLNMLLGAGILLLVSLATVTVFIGTQKLKRKNKPQNQVENRAILFTFLGVVLLSFSTFIAPMGTRFLFYVALLVVISLFVFVTMPALIKWLMGKWNALSEKRFFTTYRLKHTPLRYAVKNVFSVKILHNISRLLALLTYIMLTSALLVVAAFGNVKFTYMIFKGDYMVFNATESCVEKVSQCTTVEEAVRGFLGDTDEVRVVSADSASGLGFDIKQMPKGNQAVLASGEAKRKSLQIGDTFTVMLDGRELELVVSDIVDAGMALMVFDCEHFGIAYNMLVLQGAEGVSRGELLQDVTDKTALELAAVMPIEDVFEDKLSTVYICLTLGLIFLGMIAVFAFVGTMDNLYESYRARQEEFVLYASSGMSAKEIRRMKLWEVVLTFGGGIAFGVLCFVVMAFASNSALQAFAFETFINTKIFLS